MPEHRYGEHDATEQACLRRVDCGSKVLMRTLIVTSVVGAALLTGCGSSGDGQTADTATTTTVTATPTPTPTPGPQVVEAGEPFTIGQYEFTDWTSLTTSLEVSGVFGTITNRGDKAGIGAFRLTFYTGSSVLARFECASGGSLQPGDSEQIECDQTAGVMAATPHEPPYDKITAEQVG